ncbi:phosphonoacetaldehyde hydrolase [Zavarzinella formosa]|uniref:phosphonoacetaldehyde hydrolase n=1 Tax=Zavarzinella formosa TaxID=360055 RepID=UPI0002FD3F80|nr:phosphonoacetaldehyde hydrolase [Zavarzinella formosa]
MSSLIKLVVFDWAGTTVDFGSYAPVVPFTQAMAKHGMTVTPAEVRGPMGLHKRDHLRLLMQLPASKKAFHHQHGRDWIEADVEKIYQQDLIPIQMAALEGHSELLPHVLDTVETLRTRGIKIGTSTGYFREAALVVFASAKKQGYVPDCNILPDDVPQARPAPWMIFRNMETLNVFPPTAVVKVGDTPSDMAEARNAGCWAIGVLATGSEVGVTKPEWQNASAAQRETWLKTAREKMMAAGAHDTIDTMEDLPEKIRELETKMN